MLSGTKHFVISLSFFLLMCVIGGAAGGLAGMGVMALFG